MIRVWPVATDSVGSRLNVPCRIIAMSSPAIGASHFTRRSPDRDARPRPTPVIDVNRGCAKPVNRIRTMKIRKTFWMPVAGPY
jgi:hypothetical protein